jgi:hypothetical protein
MQNFAVLIPVMNLPQVAQQTALKIEPSRLWNDGDTVERTVGPAIFPTVILRRSCRIVSCLSPANADEVPSGSRIKSSSRAFSLAAEKKPLPSTPKKTSGWP